MSVGVWLRTTARPLPRFAAPDVFIGVGGFTDDVDDPRRAFGARHAPILPQPAVERERAGSINNWRVVPE